MSFWTDERSELLQRLWQAGESAEHIAKTLGEGCTRSAVLGRVHRTIGKGNGGGSKTHKPAKEPKLKPIVARRPAPAPQRVAHPTPIIIPDAPPPEGGVPFLAIRDGLCPWPLNDPGDIEAFRFCGGAAAIIDPYCRHHTKMAAGRGTFSEQMAAKPPRPRAGAFP